MAQFLSDLQPSRARDIAPKPLATADWGRSAGEVGVSVVGVLMSQAVRSDAKLATRYAKVRHDGVETAATLLK